MITFEDVNCDEIKQLIMKEIYDTEILETTQRIEEKRKYIMDEKRKFKKDFIRRQVKSIETLNFKEEEKEPVVTPEPTPEPVVVPEPKPMVKPVRTSPPGQDKKKKGDYDHFEDFLRTDYKHVEIYKKSEAIKDITQKLGREKPFKIQQRDWHLSYVDRIKPHLIENCEPKKHGWYKNPFYEAS